MNELGQKARIESYGAGKVTIKNLLQQEIELLQGLIMGTMRIECVGGTIAGTSRFTELPAPEDDPVIGPHWGVNTKYSNLEAQDMPQDVHSAHISIQHLCGYNWTEQGYKKEAIKLESFGFKCLRSHRGQSGQCWEVWYLPYLGAAQGDLKQAIKRAGPQEKEQVKAAMTFLAKTVSFGSCDVSIQRLAMTVD